MPADEERATRAAERRGRLVLRKTWLGDESDPAPTFGAEAVSLATRLSREAWALTGRAMPDYARTAVPVRFVPRGP